MFPYILIVLAFLADRLSKGWAADYLAEHGPTKFNTFFTLQETYNRGIAFGMFQGIGPVVGWLTIAVVIGLFFYLRGIPRSMWLVRIGISLIIGGALGNLVDRIITGEVLDFIQTPLRSGIFNVADVTVNLGLILTLIGSYWQSPPEENIKFPNKELVENNETES